MWVKEPAPIFLTLFSKILGGKKKGHIFLITHAKFLMCFVWKTYVKMCQIMVGQYNYN